MKQASHADLRGELHLSNDRFYRIDGSQRILLRRFRRTLDHAPAEPCLQMDSTICDAYNTGAQNHGTNQVACAGL